MNPPSPAGAAPAVSIVVPVRNEADNVGPLIEEIARALDGCFRDEIVFVNDGHCRRIFSGSP